MFDWSEMPGDARAVAARERVSSAEPLTRWEASNGRRALLKRSGALAALAVCGLFTERQTLAAPELAASDAASVQEALAALDSVPATDSHVVLKVPEVAENGAAVPVSVECNLPCPQEILIVVEANPIPLAARFTIPEGTDPFVSLRIKLAQSSRVYAVVKARGKVYSVVKETQVTIGGCG